MPEHEPYNDSTLGFIIWNDAQGEWEATLAFPSGGNAKCTICPENCNLHLSAPELDESRACLRWVQAHEPVLRQYVADKMYELMLDWHDPEWGPPLTKEEFRDKIELGGVMVLEDHRASLNFTDAECFGGHAITFEVGADGKLDDEPYLWG